MEWYTLDASLRRDQVIEGFQSFIWTERYSAWGEFQIVTQSTFKNRSRLAVDTMIAMAGSTYVMKVDTISDDTAEDGSRNLTITGKSLEALLEDRVAMPALGDLTTTPNYVLIGTPGDIARELFNHICVQTALDVHDTIPFYTIGTLLPKGNLTEPADTITLTAGPDTLYNTLKKLCDTYSLGFRLVRNGELGQIYFEVYVGNDVTAAQNLLTPVVFDPNLDNLEKISFLTSSAIIKTVAYVFAANGSAVVYAPDADQSAFGSGRRVLLVSSSNNSVAGPDLTAALIQEGFIALANQRAVFSFDGALPPMIPYVYGRDYKLGDLVEERNSDGAGNQMVVTEQIFVSDSTGERAYPTLSLNQVITPGSWLSWAGAQAWADVDPADVWNNI